MDYDEDRKEVIAYGLTALLQMTVIFTIITILGLIFDFWYESLIIFFGVGIIRKSTGGAHSRTMNGCIVISVLSVTLLSAMSRHLLNHPWIVMHNMIISSTTYIICLLVFYLRVPVDNPNKPIVKPEKIKRLRRQSFLVLTIFFCLSILGVLFTEQFYRLYSIVVILRLTMLWQAFTLTKTGVIFFEKVDLGFEVIFQLK